MKSWISPLLLALVVAAGCRRATEPAPPATPPATQTVATPPAVPVAPPKPVEAPPVPPAPPASDRVVEQALALKTQGQPTAARELLQALALTTNAAEKVLTTLGELNSQLLLSGAPTAATTNYTIQPGDTLGGIARTFGTTIDLLQRANGLASDTIRAGRRLSVCLSKFTVDVSKTANTLTVTDSGAFFKRYRVGTGQFNKTPVGEFKITNRAEHPVWYRPDGKTVPYGDPDNILGTHWLGLNVAGYGLHGTWETNSIGKQSSAGCIRLLNDDIAELYTILPVGTPVTIHE